MRRKSVGSSSIITAVRRYDDHAINSSSPSDPAVDEDAVSSGCRQLTQQSTAHLLLLYIIIVIIIIIIIIMAAHRAFLATAVAYCLLKRVAI